MAINMNDFTAYKEQIKSYLLNPEFFADYHNPYKDQIRSYNEQANELVTYYKELF